MKASLRRALFIALFDLKFLLKQKETLMWTFVMPGLFFYFIGTVMGGGGYAANSDRPTPIELELPYAVPRLPAAEPSLAGAPDWSGDVLLGELVVRLTADHFAVRLKTPSDPAGEATKRIVWPALPEGHATWTSALTAGLEARPQLVANRSGNAATFDELRVSQALYGLLADMVVLDGRGVAFTREAFAAIAAEPRGITLAERTAGERPAPPEGFEQTIPGTMVMFTMMILLTGGSILLIQERRAGLFRRLASSPIPVGNVLVGKWLARMALAAIQLAYSMALGAVLFGMDWGSSLGAVCVLLFLWASFCASLSLMLATIARTEGQMTGLAVIGTLVLAALGGCWWPIEITPAWMQDLADCLPTGWAMSGMHELVHFGHGFASVTRQLALLAGGTLVALWIGARRFRFE